MYADAHNAVYGTDIREGHVFMCTRDLEYQQFDVCQKSLTNGGTSGMSVSINTMK